MARRPFDVLVVGSVNLDLVCRVARLPRPGETVSGGVLARHPGGKGGNQAVAAARLEGRVAFVGAVGADDDGTRALSDLRAEGVDVAGVTVLPEAATGVALIVVDERGENQIAVASGANARVDGRVVETALAGLSVSAGAVYLASMEVGDEALVAGARWALERGLHVVLNAAPARPLVPELLETRPILLLNAGEALLLTGQAEAPAAARSLAGAGAAAVLVSLGAEGALLCRSNELLRLPAPRVTVLDTTGAGDTLAGAFAAQLAAGVAIEPAARFALAAAAISVTRPGARGGMPRRAEVEALLG